MDDHQIERTARIMVGKYEKKALTKAVEAAKYYLENRSDDDTYRWIKISYAIKAILEKETEKA
ncbi:hypothetical protein N9W34_05125 [Rickettsiales bacterium]|nr:hypothetical protein [Rickettsiales bacterium]